MIIIIRGHPSEQWCPMMVSSNSHTQVSNRKQGMQIPFCNFPMQVPMHIPNANFLCNFQCKFPMQISNVNFICNFLCIFQCNLLCTPACKTNIQGPPMQRRDKSFASSRPARCIGGVLPSTARPPLAQLQDAPVQFQTAPIQCCPGMSSAIQYCPDQGGLCCNPSPICQQGQGTHLHQLHQQQQRVQHPTAV